MKNTHLQEESKNAASGFSHRSLEFSCQPNRPTKPTFTKTCSPEESENATVRRNPASSEKPNKEESSDQETALSGRERLKRHREEIAGKVSIPEKWGKEGLLKNWMDFSVFDSAFTSNQVFSARASLMADSTAAGAAGAAGRGVSRQRLRIESSC
ncbi:PREDICTED: uncharacterized protein LOC104810919 [Tarenaya hassleriana]|uniref:uncharacterized protein LOC104810919 n=1 Tax=Tarenaya hassleriana TaxID=28532 RepID=UPI00053C6BA9|nr:PREDICTED: uncharacterized protein LOC104810919 [Tarenaya hassleriana]